MSGALAASAWGLASCASNMPASGRAINSAFLKRIMEFLLSSGRSDVDTRPLGPCSHFSIAGSPDQSASDGSSGLKPLVAVVGPTGSGKSELALAVAAHFQGEIINCDSLQVYRHFDIGTAKLPESERRGIPHHLIDIVNPDQIFTAGEFSRMARE